MNNELYNEEYIYDTEISPLVTKLIEICNKNKIPMVASFAYENCEDNGVGCCTTSLNDFKGREVSNFKSAVDEIYKPSGGFVTTVTISK